MKMTNDEVISDPLYKRAKHIKIHCFRDSGVSIQYIIKFIREWEEVTARIKKYGK